MSAVIEGDYRYLLARAWDAMAEPMTWIMLNPSTADATVDDPTIRRCIGFAKAWGFGSIYVVNLFALRSTNPAALRTHPDPIGPKNDRYIREATEHSSLNVAAWGSVVTGAGFGMGTYRWDHPVVEAINAILEAHRD